jgi:hypothetical protein
MGFKNGTNNLDASDAAAMRRHVRVGSADEPAWMHGGTYLVTRRIRIRIERWDASDLDEQETDVGRRKVSGAPFGAGSEVAPVVPEPEPPHCHIMLANPRRAGSEAERILRRGYSFDDGLLPNGDLDAGRLFFAAFQRDPRRQFMPIQRRLAEHDLLGEYLVHTGSAVFAVPPGCRRVCRRHAAVALGVERIDVALRRLRPHAIRAVAGDLVGHVLRTLPRLAGDLSDLVLDLIGRGADPVVFDPAARQQQPHEESHRGGPDRKPDRVLLRELGAAPRTRPGLVGRPRSSRGHASGRTRDGRRHGVLLLTRIAPDPPGHIRLGG